MTRDPHLYLNDIAESIQLQDQLTLMALSECRLHVNDIAESIHDFENYPRGMSEEGFRASRLVQDAVVRRLEIIGEAARQLPTAIK